MKQIQVYPNHIRIRHLDLVLMRPREESIAHSLRNLARLGFDTRPENVDVRGFARSDPTREPRAN
jgi:hypothetical protein